MVSGDGPALAEASGNFQQIGEGLKNMAQALCEDRDKQLKNWSQEAGTAAKNKLEELSKGIEGIAGTAHGVADTLTMWSIVMQVIEETIKAIISELVFWCIYAWLPALASSVFSFGASVAATMANTVGHVATALSKAFEWLGKLFPPLKRFATFLDTWGERLQGFKGALNAYKAAWESPLGLSGTARRFQEMNLGQAVLHSVKEGGYKAVEETIGLNPGSMGSGVEKVKGVTGMIDKMRERKDNVDDIFTDGEDDKYTTEETRRNLEV